MVPDIIAWGVPFVTGGAGIILGLKVGIARLEERCNAVHEKVNENRAKLAMQVGDAQCEKYREKCQKDICHSLDAIFVKLDKIDTNQVNFAIQLAKLERNGD